MSASQRDTRVPLERLHFVKKRDGREVPFDVTKIAEAIAAAMEAAGDRELGFAGEVASVVELTLAQRGREAREAARRKPKGAEGPEGEHDSPGYVPTIEQIQDLVEEALMELGRSEVAKAYILYRDRRARIRAALSVHSDTAARGLVRVREAEGVSPWSKGRIVAALMEEAELSRGIAEEIASAVERRVFASELKRLTTGLIRELVASELFERGLTHALRRQSSVGLARHDLVRLIEGQPLTPWERQVEGVPAPSTDEAIARDLLRRFVLDEVLDDNVAELHRAGDLHVENLGRPARSLAVCIETELLASGGRSATSAFDVLEGVASLGADVARFVVLERPGQVLAPLLRSARAGSPLGLAAWLRGLAATARASRVRVELGSSGARFTTFTARLVEELAELAAGPYAPGLHLDGHELEEVLAARSDLGPAVDRLFGEGRLVTTWGEGEESYAGPGCTRRARERGVLSCGGAVAINLPRLARRAGPWREDLVLAGLADLVQAALEIARALERGNGTANGAREPDRPAGLRTRVSWALTPVGLREALLILGDGEVDPEQGSRLLGLVSEAAHRFALEGASIVAPSPFFGERAAARFAWLDDRARRANSGRQHLLFRDSAESESPRPYTVGFGLSPMQGRASGRSEAECLRTLGHGALGLAGLCGALDQADPTPYLSLWRRFEVLRRRNTGEFALELFPVPRATEPQTKKPLRPLS